MLGTTRLGPGFPRPAVAPPATARLDAPRLDPPDDPAPPGSWAPPDGDPLRAIVVDASPAETSPAATLAEHLAGRIEDVEILEDGVAPGLVPDTDLVIGVTGPDGDASTAAAIATATQARFVVVLRGLADDRERVAPALRAAQLIAIPSEPFRHALTAHDIDSRRIALLPPWAHGAPTSFDRTDARRRLGWPKRGFIAVHTGPLDAVHDPADLLDAARLLGPDCLIAIVGDGPDRAEVEARAQGISAVRVSGPLADDQAPLALVAADALLVTERGDTGLLTPPIQVADYLAAGRPVVAAVPFAGTVAAELSRSAGAGLVVPPGEPGRLAGALLALHADPGRRVGMSLAGLAYAEAQLSRRAVLTRFDRIVDTVLAEPAPCAVARGELSRT